MIELKPGQLIEKGKLSSGKTWELVASRKRMVNKHLILHVKGNPNVTLKTRKELLKAKEKKVGSFSLNRASEILKEYLVLDEQQEMLGLAYMLGNKHAIVPERFRVEVNSKVQATREGFHVHIKCPDQDEQLPPLVPR